MNGHDIAVKPETEFVIRLEATPTAGYRWRLDAHPDAIKPLGESIEHPPGPQQVGGSATQVFRFRAIDPGQFTLGFSLKREWEIQPRQEYVVNVTVK